MGFTGSWRHDDSAQHSHTHRHTATHTDTDTDTVTVTHGRHGWTAQQQTR
jgi:hypothetical protein